MTEKPTVFNYQDYVELRKAFADLSDKYRILVAENQRLKDRLANLEIRYRIAEEKVMTHDQAN